MHREHAHHRQRVRALPDGEAREVFVLFPRSPRITRIVAVANRLPRDAAFLPWGGLDEMPRHAYC